MSEAGMVMQLVIPRGIAILTSFELKSGNSLN